jgi:hypothetical protein
MNRATWLFHGDKGKKKMLKEAEKAASSIRHLQALYDTYGDEFKITGMNLGSSSKLPGLHLHEDTLETLFDRDEWAWSERLNQSEFTHRASVAMFDVEFFAIFSRDAAMEYGCPECLD